MSTARQILGQEGCCFEQQVLVLLISSQMRAKNMGYEESVPLLVNT